MLFWHFVIYSFFGYLLEKGFAAAVRSPHRVRRCFLLSPLCPVYGLGMLAVLAGGKAVLSSPLLPLWGAAAATAVEFAVHWLYDKLLGVRFWDYSPVRGDIAGRVCLPFSVIWGVLIVVTVRYVHPWVVWLAAALPPQLTYAAALVLTADAVLSAQVLRRGGDVGLMSVKSLLKALEI